MEKHELERRTKAFAVAVLRFLNTVPDTASMRVIAHQLSKCATSVGANYREANRAQSRNDFVHKIAICEKESAESSYWLEILEDLEAGRQQELHALSQESREFPAMFTSIGRTTKANSVDVSPIRNPKSEIRNSHV